LCVAVVCLNRKMTLVMLTVIVFTIFAIAITKGVAYFDGKNEHGEPPTV
jgi:hypothetical protein